MALFVPGQPAPSGAQRLRSRREERSTIELFNARREVGATFTDIPLAEVWRLREAGLDWPTWSKSQSSEQSSGEAVVLPFARPESPPAGPDGQQ